MLSQDQKEVAKQKKINSLWHTRHLIPNNILFYFHSIKFHILLKIQFKHLNSHFPLYTESYSSHCWIYLIGLPPWTVSSSSSFTHNDNLEVAGILVADQTSVCCMILNALNNPERRQLSLYYRGENKILEVKEILTTESRAMTLYWI